MKTGTIGKNNHYKSRSKNQNHQLRWLNSNKTDIYLKSNTLYEKYIKGLLPQNVINRCCNFKLLEEKCKEYNTVLSQCIADFLFDINTLTSYNIRTILWGYYEKNIYK